MHSFLIRLRIGAGTNQSAGSAMQRRSLRFQVTTSLIAFGEGKHVLVEKPMTDNAACHPSFQGGRKGRESNLLASASPSTRSVRTSHLSWRPTDITDRNLLLGATAHSALRG